MNRIQFLIHSKWSGLRRPLFFILSAAFLHSLISLIGAAFRELISTLRLVEKYFLPSPSLFSPNPTHRHGSAFSFILFSFQPSDFLFFLWGLLVLCPESALLFPWWSVGAWGWGRGLAERKGEWEKTFRVVWPLGKTSEKKTFCTLQINSSGISYVMYC